MLAETARPSTIERNGSRRRQSLRRRRRPGQAMTGVLTRGVFACLRWAYDALPMPLVVGIFYYGFQSVPNGLRGVEALRVGYGARSSGIESVYGLGEAVLVRWGDLGVLSAFYCLTMMTAAYTVMVMMDIRDYILDTWALIVDEALEVKAQLRADDDGLRMAESGG